VIPFFSHTGTKTTIAAARHAGWGILLSASAHPRAWHHEDFELVGGDNGQWAERNEHSPFKEDRFLRFVDAIGSRPLWIVLPDIVCGGLASLDLTLTWLDRMRGHPSILLIAVQNGMTPAMIRPFLSKRVGIFVGGDDSWKMPSLPIWASLAKEVGCYIHVGRVNTAKRMFACIGQDVDSCDGTSVTQFPCTLPMLDQAARHRDMFTRFSLPPEATPSGFTHRCREIVATMQGHDAHRALDMLTNDVLAHLGYAEGIKIFEAAVRDWHASELPYPAALRDHLMKDARNG
jgi:hypothetical protein